MSLFSHMEGAHSKDSPVNRRVGLEVDHSWQSLGEMTQQVESVIHHYLEAVRPIDVVSTILSPLLILSYACAFPLQAYLGLFKAWGCCRCR